VSGELLGSKRLEAEFKTG